VSAAKKLNGTLRIFHIDDDDEDQRAVEHALEAPHGVEIKPFKGIRDLSAYESNRSVNVAIVDAMYHGRMIGPRIIEHLHKKYPGALIVVLTNYPDSFSPQQLDSKGVVKVLDKANVLPHPGQLRQVVREALTQHHLELPAELKDHWDQLDSAHAPPARDPKALGVILALAGMVIDVGEPETVLVTAWDENEEKLVERLLKIPRWMFDKFEAVTPGTRFRYQVVRQGAELVSRVVPLPPGEKLYHPKPLDPKDEQLLSEVKKRNRNNEWFKKED
jgi:CheY-like chemotaxis protein